MVPAAVLLRPLLLLLFASYRLRVVHEDSFERRLSSGEPAIYASWHGRLFPGALYVIQRLRRLGHRMAVLVSLSRDGELVARMARSHGLEVVRGSTSRGGHTGLLRLVRALRRDRSSVMTAPDGPRGPARVAQAGTLLLARLSGAPIVPIAFAARSVWRFTSWDRMVLPKPFARVVVAIGEPFRVAPGDEDLAAAARALSERLDGLVEEAEAALPG